MSNDRFKFRVWDNINKRYDKDLSLIDKDGDLCYQDGGKYCNGEHPEDFTIEQCTGIRDRNNKLIYEGDILRLSFDDGGKVDREIYYAQGCAQYFLRHLNERLFDCYTFNSSVANDLEIIGNIHEMEGK